MSIMDSIEERYEDQIAALTESRDHWKRQWRLMEAAEKKAEEQIAMLKAENTRLREGLLDAKWRWSTKCKYWEKNKALQGGEE